MYSARKNHIPSNKMASTVNTEEWPVENGTSPDIPADELDLALVKDSKIEVKSQPMQIVWRNVILMSMLHIGAVIGIFLFPQAKTATKIWTVILYILTGHGITAGAHRLWAHRSYKAKLPLRIYLALLDSMAFQNDIIEWARDHRVHHKYSETDADPHNAKRGFFFSHIGWLLTRKHPAVKEKGKKIDLSDLYADPVLIFQRKYYLPSVILMCFIVPTTIPVLFFGESFLIAYFVSAVMRYCLVLNATWLVNSAAHMWGWKPYDKSINPSENPAVAFLAVGEGFHNFHHTFPHDYSTAELSFGLNISKLLIDFYALIGQAYDRKAIPKHFVDKRRERTGDRMKTL